MSQAKTTRCISAAYFNRLSQAIRGTNEISHASGLFYELPLYYPGLKSDETIPCLLYGPSQSLSIDNWNFLIFGNRYD